MASKRTTPPVSNAKLEADILRGDREAVAAALLVLAEKLVQAKLWMFPPRLEAEDVIQDAAFDALQRLAGWESSKGTAVTYATGAIGFVILDRMRKARRYEGHHVEGLDVEQLAA